MLKPKINRVDVWSCSVMSLLALVAVMTGFAGPSALSSSMMLYGGSAFLLIYLFCLVVIGVPLMMAWLFIGRRADAVAPASSVLDAARQSKISRHWVWIGHFWRVLALLFLVGVALTGAGQVAQLSNGLGGEWALSVGLVIFLLGVLVLGALSPNRQNLINGLLLIAMLVLSGYLIWQLGGEGKGYQVIGDVFAWRAEQLSVAAMLAALFLSFKTASVGGAVLWLYGRYLPAKPTSLMRWSALALLVQTLVALVVGVAAFNNASVGFAVLVSLASLAVAIALGEAVAMGLLQKGVKRIVAILIAMVVVGLLVTLQQQTGALDWLGGLTQYVLLPLAVITVSAFVGWMLKETQVRKVMAEPSFGLYMTSRALLRLAVPLAALVVLLAQVGSF